MEIDPLRKEAMSWWQSKSNKEKKRIAHANAVHLNFEQFSKSPRMITRAYLKSQRHVD